MIRKNRSYKKGEAFRDAKLIFIYCEGEKREKDYFDYFTNKTQKIIFTIIPPENGESSPEHLLTKAEFDLIDESKKYDLSDEDEVWFVIDTDRWGKAIPKLRKECVKYNWNIAQSNPCFEVWLYYHFQKFELFNDMEKGQRWKEKVHEVSVHGFHSDQHPVYIASAIIHAKEKYVTENQEMNIGCSEVFKLAESFYPFVQKQIQN
ncbi:MAG: RloB family protein [Campylobacterota bacterium]|nr:RloB family protein [Campylobacterota bacterium]